MTNTIKMTTKEIGPCRKILFLIKLHVERLVSRNSFTSMIIEDK